MDIPNKRIARQQTKAQVSTTKQSQLIKRMINYATVDTNSELVTIIIKNLDECKSNATEKHSLSGGTASANFGKKTTFQS